MVPGQRCAPLSQPVLEVDAQVGVLGEGDEGVRPAAEGGRPPWERRLVAGRQLAVHVLDVVEDDAPGDGVDREVVDCDEQPGRLVGHLRERDPGHERASFQVELFVRPREPSTLEVSVAIRGN